MSPSEDLFLEARPRAVRAACCSVTDDILERGLEAIWNGLPLQVLKLTKLCEGSVRDEGSIFHTKWDTRWPVSSSTLKNASTDLDRPVVEASQVGVTRGPQHIYDLWDRLMPLVQEIIDMFDLVQLYLLFRTPGIEEGNNTGVEIQQQCIKLLLDARRYVVGCQGYPKLYATQRAKLASKCLKYPELEDYKRALFARDEEECRDCRYLLSRLRVQVLGVVDIIHKNFSRVDQPKSVTSIGAISMY